MDRNEASVEEQEDQNQTPENEQASGDGNIDETASEASSAEETDAQEETTENLKEKIRQLEEQLSKANQSIEESSQKVLRVQADFDNFRRRTRTEKEELTQYASVGVIEKLLPFIDNFERALSVSKENKDTEALIKGLDMIHNQLNQALEQEQLEVIKSVGEPFNPEFHQAVMQVESDEYEEGIVVEELQKGFILKNKVLRPSMVKVSK